MEEQFARRRLRSALEAVESGITAVRLPDWLRQGSRVITDSAPHRQHPFWALLKKELRLQQLTLIVIAIVVLAALTLRAKGGFAVAADAMLALTVSYLMLVGVLIGSLASAEERHFGMIEPQILSPVPRLATVGAEMHRRGHALVLARF